jgi:tetratricopeptide (TPR) repeat protein
LNVPRRWLFGWTALVFAAFAYFGLVKPALFPPRFEIGDSVIDAYLKSKDIPISSAEAKALKEQFTRVSKELEDLRTRNPETGGQIAAAIKEFENGSPDKAIVNLERLIAIIDTQRQKMTLDQATAEHALAALGYFNNVAKALPHYRMAAELAQSNVWYWIDYGKAASDSGNISDANSAFARAQVEAEKLGDAQGEVTALMHLGESLLQTENLDTAEKIFRKSLDISRRLAAANPSNAELSRNVSIGLVAVGDVMSARIEFDEAQKAYTEGLEIRRRLIAANPNRAAEMAREVSIILGRIGEVMVARNDLAGALKVFEEGLQIAKRSLAMDPDDDERARDVSIELEQVGGIMRARNDFDGAQQAFEEVLRIRRSLVAAKPGHAVREQDVAIILDEIGSLMLTRNDPAGALKVYLEGLEIRERLMAGDPIDVERARDVFTGFNNIGDVRRITNDLDGAIEVYEEGLQIAQRLMEAEPSHASRARDVFFSLNKLGNALSARNDQAGALKAYEEGLKIGRHLMSANPTHSKRALDLFFSLTNIGIAQRDWGAKNAACARFIEALNIIWPMTKRAPDFQPLQRYLTSTQRLIAETGCPF